MTLTQRRDVVAIARASRNRAAIGRQIAKDCAVRETTSRRGPARPRGVPGRAPPGAAAHRLTQVHDPVVRILGVTDRAGEMRDITHVVVSRTRLGSTTDPEESKNSFFGSNKATNCASSIPVARPRRIRVGIGAPTDLRQSFERRLLGTARSYRNSDATRRSAVLPKVAKPILEEPSEDDRHFPIRASRRTRRGTTRMTGNPAVRPSSYRYPRSSTEPERSTP